MTYLSKGGRRRPGLAAMVAVLIAASCARAADPHPLLPILEAELKHHMEQLQTPEGIRPYFIQYAVTDFKTVNISASLGAVTSDQTNASREFEVRVRCGDYKIDNTRQIRGDGYFYGGRDMSNVSAYLPLNGDPLATRHAVWLKTDEAFKAAAKRLAQVKINLKVKVEEEDPSDDFSRETASEKIGPWVTQTWDHDALLRRIREYSRRFRSEPNIYNSSVSLSGSIGNRIAVNSEGSKLQFGDGWWRISIEGSTIAEDGMELWQYHSFDAHAPERLPSDDVVMKGVERVIGELNALRKAPIVEPYTGPAILLNRASGVFFHEIFGHRIEGHRQKDVGEGQTFAKKLNAEVLPKFLSVTDDPSRRLFKNIELNGFYEFDDECVPAQPAHLVQEGILKTFLMSRSPTRGINKSNGHGRAQTGMSVVARQGNLVVESRKAVPHAKLREMLIDEVKKQGKEYGLLFADISGGFTNTQRYSPQAFKVMPIIVYRVYADGRPDELVRGVDIVGTPLTCFSKIVATDDNPDVFNGVCGAESGWVPVSAISPSILVEQIEIEKKQKAQDRPPILPAPIATEKTKSSGRQTAQRGAAQEAHP